MMVLALYQQHDSVSSLLMFRIKS